jgi:hypothetical protein
MRVPKTASNRQSDTHKCFEGEVDQNLAFAISNEDLEKDYRLICLGSPLSALSRVLNPFQSS